MSTPYAAANAYAALSGLMPEQMPKAKTIGLEGVDGAEGPKFGSLVEESLGGFMQQGQKMESAVLQSGGTQANIVDMVTAVSETEMQLSTLVALRDKVIDAYEKIMNMPV